jgi:hypothetical protein
VVRPLYYYQADLGAVYVFDNYNYLDRYVWAAVMLYSPDLPYVARATLSAGYLRPAASDPNWGAMVFEWRYVATPQGLSAELPDGTRRVMVLAGVYQGASSTPVLTVRDMRVRNYADPPAQRVRIYVGLRLVSEIALTKSGYAYYTHPGVTINVPQALDYMRFNSSHVPIIIEFDPPLKSGGPYQQPVFSASIELGGRRWPQIWRGVARNWDWMNAPLLYLGQREGANEFVGNAYGFNVWNKYAFKNGTANLLGKVDVETQLRVYPADLGLEMAVRVTASYIGFKRAPSALAPYMSYACIAQSSSNVQGLNVTGPGNLEALQYWASAASAGYWFINTFLTFSSLFVGVPRARQLRHLGGRRARYEGPPAP